MDDNKDLLQQEDVEIIDESQSELTEILENFAEPQVKKEKKKKQSMAKTLIICLVIVAVICGGIFAITQFDFGGSNSNVDIETAEILTSLDDDNQWQVEVPLNDKGEISQNGQGTLQNYTPAKIDNIQIKNESGNFQLDCKVVTTENDEGEEEETSVYTLVGFEDFELQSGAPDEVANYAASTSFTTIIKANATENLADYGLKEPRATALVKFTDDTSAFIRVGSVAPQSEQVYIAFGSNDNVYLVDSEYVEAFLYDVTDLISLTVTDTVTESDNSKFEYVKISGNNFDQTVTVKYNDNSTRITNSYMLITDIEEYADNSAASTATGTIRGLYADKVVCVAPSERDLQRYGLAESYAQVEGKYPDATINLISSKEDENGNCYVMRKDGKVIYQVASTSVSWATISYDDLLSTYVLAPELTGLESVTIEFDGEKYTFDLNTETVKSTDDDGYETSSTTTEVEYKGKEITLGYFETFFSNLSLVEKCELDRTSPKGKEQLTVTYKYSRSNDKDVIKYYKGDNNKSTVTLNGVVQGKVYTSYVSNLIKQTPKMAKDIEVNSFW